MLHKLMLREWILNRRAILAAYGIFAAFQIYFALRVDSMRAWLVFSGIYAAFIGLTLYTREDKFGAASWSCTLPATRRELVQARFLASWVLAMLYIALTALFTALLPGSRVSLPGLLDPVSLLLAASVMTLVISLMLPFTIRFGMLGVLIFLVAAQMLGAVVLLVAVSMRSGGAHAGPGLFGGGIQAIKSGLMALREALTADLFHLLAAAVLVLLNWCGYRLAVALFRRKEL